MVVEGLQKSYEENELNVNRVVECGQDAQVLDKLLSSKSLALALDVAAVASKRDLVDLESWVVDGIEKHGESFVQAVLDFLDRKVNSESSATDGQSDTVPLTPPVYATFFRALRNSNSLSAEDIGHFKEIRNLCLQLHPRLMNLNPDADTEPGLSVVAFPPEIDAQVDDFYQRMYAEEISLDHVIEVFQRLKKSESRQERQLFACMLHTLFDEYKFVQTYPPRELAMTGLLFGSIIQYHLVEGTPLHVAVRYVLDALQSNPESTMFSFGKNALNIFQSRLPEFPLMCRALLEIPHLHDSNPVLMSIIRTALTERGMDRDDGSRPPSPERIVFSALQIEELDQDEQEDVLTLPEERISDKILFIVNNLAPTNFEEKAEDLKRLIAARYSRWFADYLVNTRVSVEPNNHGLYMQLLETLSMAILEKHVLWETYRKSAQLLNSEKTLDNSQDKVILKNIASWLGKLTVARDLPIRHRQLSLKDLLVQGYDEKRLQVAIPFVCKIMEQCSKSSVFHPPNPWLMAVMGLLIELYQFAELKLNLKFEIEVLCKTLDVDLLEIQPSNILRRRTPPVPPTQPARLAQELDRITMVPGSGFAPSTGVGGRPVGPGEAAQQAVQDAFLRRIDELIAQLSGQLLFNPAYPMFQSTAALKRIVHLSIDRALREIINPVVERSVTIAGISSRDLLMKDFGMESDETKLRQAAHLMVSKLAGSLALVTCKEPLRTSMLNNIRTMMLQSGFTEVS
jgi:CCR4-NOT transcription complex subunit 1